MCATILLDRTSQYSFKEKCMEGINAKYLCQFSILCMISGQQRSGPRANGGDMCGCIPHCYVYVYSYPISTLDYRQRVSVHYTVIPISERSSPTLVYLLFCPDFFPFAQQFF